MPEGQMPLALAHEPSWRREDLAVSTSNEAAVHLIDDWPVWHFYLAAIVGPHGSGKTHLASVWRERAAAIVVDASAVTAADLQAAEQGRPVLCDGIVEGRIDETGLFHLLNAVRSAGSTMLMTATVNPSSFAVATPDLLSRFRAATVAVIALPDDALLKTIIAKLFSDRQLAVDTAVIAFLAARMERSLSTAMDVVARIDRLSLSARRPVTRAMAARALDEGGAGQASLEF